MDREIPPNQVVCAIDANDFDQSVVDLAADMARQFGSDLHLIHVSLFPDSAGTMRVAYPGSPDTVIHDHAKFMKIGCSSSSVPVHHHHLNGTPASAVLDFVNRNRPRMLVIGAHGRKGLARVLGSVAAAIIREAPCPVLVFRGQSL
jgi:nucleotide-binding universal stress UspA family protein